MSFIFTNIAFANQEEVALPTVIITAQKFEEEFGMMQTTEFNENSISSNSAKNIVELTTTAPNVERAGNVKGSNSEFRIRGMEDTRITTKIDGSKTNFRGEYKGRNFITPYMLSNITVTRGSNSVLEGSGAIAGSVDLQTKSASDIMIYEGQTSGGEGFGSLSSNGIGLNAGGAAFAIKDGYTVLGMFSIMENEDFKAGNNTKIPYTKNETDNLILKIKKDFSSTEYIEIFGSLFEEEGETTSNPFRLVNGGEPVYKNLINTREALELNLNYLNLKAFYENTHMRETLLEGERRDFTDFESYGLNVFGKYSYKAKGLNNLFIYGFDWVRDNQDGSRGGDEDRASLFPKGNALNYGFYLENALEYYKLKVLLGGRLDYYDLESGKERLSYNSDFLKKISVGYEVLEGLTPFVRYSEGYRAPFLKETFASGNILNVPNAINLNLASNTDLKAEYSKNYEIGFKYEKPLQFKKDKITFDVVYFRQDIKDFIIQDPLCTPATCSIFPTSFLFQYQNLDKVRFQGVETSFELKYNNYLFAIYASTLRAFETQSSNPLLQIPQNKLVVQVGKKFENNISVGIESVSTSGVFLDDFRTYTLNVKPFMGQPTGGVLYANCSVLDLCEATGGYSIINLNIQYEKLYQNVEYTFGFGINNIFDVHYTTQASFIPSLGRNVVISGKARF